ncbi:MAG: hypothetical protein V3T93_02760, partial [Alphaproteobacteria bacterium]
MADRRETIEPVHRLVDSVFEYRVQSLDGSINCFRKSLLLIAANGCEHVVCRLALACRPSHPDANARETSGANMVYDGLDPQV